MDTSSRCIVMGASAGGVESLLQVLGGFVGTVEAPIFVVLHLPPYAVSSLPEILAQATSMPVVHPANGARIKRGHVYVAEPDHHLLIQDGRIVVAKGPKENRFRPSIDALFRSAAYAYEERVIGVVLSGALDDGTSGLWSIKRLGGVTVVQQPGEASFPSMPRSALEQVDIDHTLAAADIGALISRIASEPASTPVEAPELKARLGKEIQIAAEGGAFQKGVMDMGVLTPFTCPECKGVLVKINDGSTSRFRCHTGHGYTSSSLLESVMETSGNLLWQVIRSFEESVMLLDQMGTHLKESGDAAASKIYLAKAKELEKRSKAFHDAALRHESLSEENLGEP